MNLDLSDLKGIGSVDVEDWGAGPVLVVALRNGYVLAIDTEGIVTPGEQAAQLYAPGSLDAGLSPRAVLTFGEGVPIEAWRD